MTAYSSRIKTLCLLGLAAAALLVLHALASSDKATRTEAALPMRECNDGRDNDHDGQIDYPEDRSCDSLDDMYEDAGPAAVVLSLTDGRSTVNPGDSVIYKLGIASDRKEEQGVDVQLLLPAFANVIGISDGGGVSGDRIVWNNVRIFPGRNRVLTVQVSIAPNAKPEYLMLAEARAGTTSASDATRVELDASSARPYGPKLQLSVTDGKTYALPEELLRYTIVVNNKDFDEVNTTLRVQVPTTLTIHEVSGPHVKDNRSIEWRNLHLLPGEGREFFVVARVNRDTQEHTALTFKVSAGTATAGDTTTVSMREQANEALSLTLSDNRLSAARGEILYYQARLTNNSAKLVTNLDANAALPTGTELVSASDGGLWTGTGINWKNLTVSPRGSRVLQFAVRVRSDAQDGSQIRGSVKAGDSVAVDITDVGASIAAATDAPARSNLNDMYGSRVMPEMIGRGMLQKYASSSEVQPGGTVVFTVSLKNTTGQSFRNVIVTDKIDGTYMKIIGKGGQVLQQNAVSWSIPELQPGMEWRTSYVVSVSPHTPHGTMLSSVVSAIGEGMQALSMSQTVYAGAMIGVIGHLPKTGAGMDALATAIGLLISFAPVAMQLKRKSRL